MVNIRTYFSLVCLTKLEHHSDYLNQVSVKSRSMQSLPSSRSDQFYPISNKVLFLYAIGGKRMYDGNRGPICQQKTIERYDVERDEWVEIKMQLTYGRAFSSAITFSNRYIYVVGGSTNTDCFEIIDTEKEDICHKSELVLLNLGNY
jgi:N-acetylneuraminic acid mutarotase